MLWSISDLSTNSQMLISVALPPQQSQLNSKSLINYNPEIVSVHQRLDSIFHKFESEKLSKEFKLVKTIPKRLSRKCNKSFGEKAGAV